MSIQGQNSETAGKPDLGNAGLIILGMHRSGTSALAGALGLCGAWLGEDEELTAPNFENPKGFWERRDIRAICDQLLNAAGADWWKVAAFEKSAIPHSVISEQGGAFRRVVAELDSHGTWALKEPRLCLLFPILRPFLLKSLCIHIHRNPLDVAQSLRTRNGFGVAEGLALWESYNLKALQASSELPRLVVSYEALVSQPEETLTTLLSDLSSLGITGLAVPTARELEEFITPGLRHHNTTVSDSVSFLLPSQQELWSRLRSGEALHAPPSSELSVVARQYLRDLESRKGSIDQLKATAMRSDAKARKSASVLQTREARIAELKTRLAERRAEAGKLASRLEAQATRAGALETSLTERAAEIQAEKGRADAFKAKLEASERSLRTVSSRARASDLRTERLEAQLSAVYSSRSWRVTAPLRAVSRLAKSAVRLLRGAFRLILWLATGQFGRAAAALLPRYRRYMPSRVKAVVPRALRERVKSRLAAAPASGRPPVQDRENAIPDEAAGAARPAFASHSFLSTRTAASRFGQELRYIADQATSPKFGDALRKSESQLAQVALQMRSTTERPLVSIVMPTHNRAAIIGGAITTVLEQEYPNWELLVCDDDSIDGTEAVVAEFFDSRIRYLKLPRRGAAAARNVGLKNARGSIIAYLDSDNLWHPVFLSTIVLALSENPGCSSVYTDFIDFHINKYGRRTRVFLKQVPFDHERLLKKPYIDLNSFAHRRELYDCFGGFDERLKRRQDYDLILKYTWLRDPLHVPCLTTLYQRNDSLAQITRTQREDRSCISIIDRSVESYFENGLPVVGRPPVKKVTILSRDSCGNHFSRAFALAEALSAEYDVQLISFRFSHGEVSAPLQGAVPRFETLYLPGSRFPDFFASMQQALAAVRGDVIYVAEPRLASLGLALLANCQRGTPIILEITHPETPVGPPGDGTGHTETGFDSVDSRSGELLDPNSDIWSQRMRTLARKMPVLVTHDRPRGRQEDEPSNVPFGDREDVSRLTRDAFDNPDDATRRRDAEHSLFLRRFSSEAARSNFRLAAMRALVRPTATLPVASAFVRRFNELYRSTAQTDRDFIPVDKPANRRGLLTAQEVQGYGESEEDESVVIVDARNVDELFHDDAAGVAVIMPSVDTKKSLETARILVKRAGMKTTVFIVQDTLRDGYVRTLNHVAHRLNVAFMVYLADDAFPGVDWLRIAHEALEKSGKGLLAFNDGKSRGRFAVFGMIRMQWVSKVYGGPILFPGYRARAAANELTLIARLMNDYIYEPTATLVGLEASGAPAGAEGSDGTEQTADHELFRERFHGTFDSRFRGRDVAPYRDEYLNPRKLRAGGGETCEPADDAVREVDIGSIRTLRWQDPDGVAVIMPCVNPAAGRATARRLVQRAGIDARVYVVEDTLRHGFIATLNDTAAQLDVKYVVYLAEDAFPGEDWLKIAHARMEETGKGLLAFNCGKWHGRVASFGMVRKDWVQRVYGPRVILYPEYKAHKADNELTVIARVLQQFVYEPDSVLMEIDRKKAFKETVPEDKAIFHRRFRGGFDGLAALEDLTPLAESYFVPLTNDPADEETTANGGRQDSFVSCRSFPRAGRTLDSGSAGASSATMTSLRAQILRHEKDQPHDPALSTVLDELRTRAEKALQRSPCSVADKTTLPPSGDRRDYWHPAPYWWPNPETPDGLPYIRKDGERVPGTRMYEPDSDKYDRTRLQRVFDDSLTLGLASYFFDEKRYAEAGAGILERFFVDPDNSMKPHLEYAQVRMGHNGNKGAPAGLIEAKDMYFYLDAVRLFHDAGVLSDEVSRNFRNWLETYLEWLLTSVQGKAESAASNNHGTCYDLQVAAVASFLGNEDIVYETLERAQVRISGQFTPEGCQPQEIKRTATAHYCCFNLQSWINLAELSSRWGVDLWACETSTGAGLKSAARWLLSHMDRPWPYAQIDEFDSKRFLPIWFAASEHPGILDSADKPRPCVYDVKAVFFPHDGIRPLWNLASYAATVEQQKQSAGYEGAMYSANS